MIDIFIIVVLLWALFSGWRSGFVKEVTSLIGALVGLLIAATCYSAFGEYLAVNGSETNMVTSVIAFFYRTHCVRIRGQCANQVAQRTAFGYAQLYTGCSGECTQVYHFAELCAQCDAELAHIKSRQGKRFHLARSRNRRIAHVFS